MRKYFFYFLILSSVCIIRAQSIGKLAPEKQHEVFPEHTIGGDLMFGEGGIGLGVFYRKQVAGNFSFFTDFSFSEAKDEHEIESWDYYTNQSYTIGKKNRVFLLPLNFGLQYRLFRDDISDNLRPYVNFGIGPSMVVTTPYTDEFFTSFKFAQAKYAAGGYIGLGANFGLDKSALLGFNIRYYIINFFDEGVESLQGRFNKQVGGFYLTINIGTMY